MNQHKNTVIIIAGPTASGKTALSLQLAAYLKTDIVSADSRQCYKELNIGVAKPTSEELQSVKHYFIDSHSIHENVTAQIFEQYALQSVNEIFQHNRFAVMVGGTGLYIKAFCEGLDAIPQVDETIRKEIAGQYNQFGLSWLQDQVKEKDPDFWGIAEQQNPQRLMRALEVISGTGKSITGYRKKEILHRPFNIIKTGLGLHKDQLYANIDARVNTMMEHGLPEEVKSLLPFKDYNALQTVGYKELFAYYANQISLAEAINKIKINTRHYAKRQITWFKKDSGIKWVTPIERLDSAAFISSLTDK